MKKKTTNIEIYNYLNIVNKRLGKLYRISGFNPLPDDFVFDENAIKERLYLGQMANGISYPKFLFEGKSLLKKRFKLSLKRINQILKEGKYDKFLSQEFSRKFEIYLVLRRELTKIIISSFSKEDFDECEAYAEICSLDTIFFDLFDGIFESEFNFLEVLNNLESQYKVYYLEKLKKIEKKNNKKIEKNIQKIIINEKINNKIIENQKNEIKIEKKTQKENKNKEIEKIKASKMQRRNKEI